MSNNCYLPSKQDKEIASKVLGWDERRVATLRGIYDDAHPNSPLDLSNIEKATNTLVAYRKLMSIDNIEKINSYGTNLSSAYDSLLGAFDAETRFNRINMVALLFSQRLTEILLANPSISRETICKGFSEGGVQKGGQTMIFEVIYNEILDYYGEALQNNDQYEIEQYSKIINNWPALVSFARMKLRDTESLKLGNKLDYADIANMDNFGENDISLLYDASESKREGWQETNDYRSSFGSLGALVRRFLGSIPKIEDGEELSDDLGFPIMLDPVRAHQSLIDILVGMSSSDRMMELLRLASAKLQWLTPIIEKLNEDNALRTKFYVDFKKAFLPYSKLKYKFLNGLIKFETVLLNRVRNLLSGQYMTRIALGKPVNERTSIYDNKGNINWKNLQNLRKLVHEYLDTSLEVFSGVLSSKIPKFYTVRGQGRISRAELKQVLFLMLLALGVDINESILDRIMSNSRDLRTVTNNIREAFTYGFEKVLSLSVLKSMEDELYSSIQNQKYKRIIKATYAASTAKDGAAWEKLDKILTIVSKNNNELKLENRVRYKDKKGKGVTLYSNVLPSYLSDFMDNISGYVKARDTLGLRTYLEERFLNSKLFKDDGIIFNKWMEELYKSDLADDNCFAANFTWERFLGDDTNSFENFTSKQHALGMLSSFFSDKLISPNSEYAHYPVFILGDSGVQKNIRAKRYSSKEVLNGLYNVYRSECRRMSLAKAANDKLRRDGYLPIKYFSERESKFTLLPFLNEVFKGRDINSISESEVKDAIKKHMNEAFGKFKELLDRLGVLDTVTKLVGGLSITQYKYLNQEAKDAIELDKKLNDFYWNTKFATIQLLLMMTIDTAYYKDTKDLQKRYKEIHAPGKVLDLLAKDSKGLLYSPNGIETCVYFEDIELPADLNFLAAIEAHFGRDSNYMKYLENTLTDGQGYRTLDSYRKVMGMAGEWTEEMENAYNEIKALRNKYGKDKDISPEDIKRISDLAVIFLPIKPYMYTIENYAINDNDILKIPVLHKYAEAVLIPELLPKGCKLRDMAYWMEEHVDENGNPMPIDLVGSTTIVKVGSFGATSLANTPDSESLNKALDKAYVHQLSYSDYRIQTNVPEHVNSSLLFGTQVRKLIMAHVNMDDYHYENYIGGKKINLGGNLGVTRLNGRNLISLYNSLIVANILESYDSFKDNVEDPEKISDMLLLATIGNSRESADNMLAYSLTDGHDFSIPLFEGGLEHDSAAMLFSIFKKLVNKLSIKGGSAVLVSAMGISGYHETGDLQYVVDSSNPNNILYAECEIPFDLSFTDSSGIEHLLDYNEWCNPDGTLKLGKVLSESDPEYRDYLPYRNDLGQVCKPLIEEKYKDILSILAYRIPTERDYSMINLKVKRFSQKIAGGTIKVPLLGTKIAGFDYDIDKLYLMRYDFKSKPLSQETIEQVWKDFYTANPQIKEALLKARQANEDTQALIKEVLSPFINSDLAKGIIQTDNTKDRLYKYWKEAGLEGTPKEAIGKYLSDNASKYNTDFIDYEYEKSPLENDRVARNNMLIKLIQNRLMDEETFSLRYTPGGFTNASNAARFLRELRFGNLEGVVSKGVSTSKISGENISSKGSEFARKLTNVGNDLKVTYKGVTFRNAEHAYQTWKSGEFDDTAYNSTNTWKPIGSKSVNKLVNFQIMVDILTEKLKQHPELIEGIKERGGYEYIISSTHNVIGDKYWESSGQNAFIKALAKAAINVGISPINNSHTKGTIDFNAIAERAKDKESDPEPNYDPSDPMTIIIYNQQNQVAGKLIGIFANQNTNHAFSTLMQLFYLKKPIAFDGHLEGLFDLLHKDNYEQIDLSIAEFLAASVDAVKDPVLNFLNLNSITADAGALLARLGYSIRDIGLLFNLPIIMLICEYSFNNNVDPSIALLEVSLQYRESTNSLDNNSNKAVDLSSEGMASNIINYRKALESNRDIMEDSSFRESLLKFALLFSEILRVSSDMSLFVTSTKFTASNAVGSTFGDLYEQQMRVDKYIKGLSQSSKALSTLVMEVAMDINSPINNTNPLGLTNQEYIERELTNPFAYEQAMYDMNRRLGELLNRYYPYNSPIYKSARDTLASWTKGQVLDADTINSMHTDLMSWLLAQLEDSLFNPDRPAKNGIPAREYYTKHFAMELFNALENYPEYKSLPIFLYMQFNMDEETDEVSVNILDVGGLMPYLKDAIRESWASLMEESPDLARDLFMYNYYKSGFSFNPFSFMHLAPTKVKKAIRVGNGTYIDFLNKVLKGDLMNNTDIQGFLQQYVRNHVDNKKLVFTPTGTTLTFIKKKSVINKVILNSFTLDVYGLGLDGDIWLLPGSNRKKRVFRPFIKIDDTLYMADNSNYGNDPNFNTSYSTAIEYRKVSILGETNKSSQYFSNSNRSLKIQAPLQADGGSTFITPDPIHDIPVFNREEEINKIIEDMVTARLKYGFDAAESVNNTRSALQLRLDKMENSTLKDLVEAIKNAARENGILVLDKDGNPVPSC